jgi:hypothetical protein
MLFVSEQVLHQSEHGILPVCQSAHESGRTTYGAAWITARFAVSTMENENRRSCLIHWGGAAAGAVIREVLKAAPPAASNPAASIEAITPASAVPLHSGIGRWPMAACQRS